MEFIKPICCIVMEAKKSDFYYKVQWKIKDLKNFETCNYAICAWDLTTLIYFLLIYNIGSVWLLEEKNT